MAKKKAGKEKVQIVLDEDDEDEDQGVKEGGMEKYEVRIEPPRISGRKAKAVRSGSDPSSMDTGPAPGGSPSRVAERRAPSTAGSSQQIYKIEDDLRRTRDTVEDLKHTVTVMESDFNDIKAEMDRISYLLRSLEGLKNTMKDIESTVSELSGLYDMISANVNPFIDIPPMVPSRGGGPSTGTPESQGEEEATEDESVDDGVFRELSDIFEEEEEAPELDEVGEWNGNDLESAEWALKWTQFLINSVGKEGLEKTLNYYLDLGWIDEDIIDQVLDIARGTAGPRRKDERKRSSWRMGADDHVRSLEFIRRMKGY